MIFNERVIGDHPVTSGYIIECFVKGNEVIDTDPTVGFPSGSGRLKIEFPEFAITGLEFQGKNLLFLPTGAEPENKLMDSIVSLESQINLKAIFSGDLNGVTGLSIQNIKQVDVYTGDEPNFEVDSLLFTNRISESPVKLNSGETSFLINIVNTQITGADEIPKVEENIFYKVIPNDFLTFGDISPVASGIMFSGFETFTKINEDPFIITRSNANDIKVSRDQITKISTGTTIVVDDTIPLDFYGHFQIGTNEKVIISGSGVELKSTDSNFTVSAAATDNSITIPINKEFVEFDISCLLDESDVRTGFIVGGL